MSTHLLPVPVPRTAAEAHELVQSIQEWCADVRQSGDHEARHAGAEIGRAVAALKRWIKPMHDAELAAQAAGASLAERRRAAGGR